MTLSLQAEFLNPAGTGKDRIAVAMIESAEAAGLLLPHGTVVEGTSGSTGISLACVCRAKGYRCIIVMPDDQAAEKVALLKTFGAQIIQVCASCSMNASLFSPLVATRRLLHYY